jgi:hypothetical protein
VIIIKRKVMYVVGYAKTFPSESNVRDPMCSCEYCIRSQLNALVRSQLNSLHSNFQWCLY